MCLRHIYSMDLYCDDEDHYNFCKINIDGGVDLNVALITEDNNFTNSSDEFDINFSIVPIDRYDGFIEQMNLAYSDYENETEPINDWPKEFYENYENIRKIQLEYQHLTKIKSSAFVGAPNIYEIDLDHNQILYIGEDAFMDLTNLTVLSLSKNNLTVIRLNTFAGCTQLRRLHLNQNKIEHIEDGAFKLPNLENILLQNNKLKKLSGSIFIGTPRLQEAVFEENELTQINDAFTHLHLLEILILDYNQIEDINLTKFAQLTELNQLSLRKSGFQLKDKNSIEDIDEKSNSSSKLEVLDLAENNLEDGDTVMVQLKMFPRVEIINFEYNEIRYLEPAYKIKNWFPHLAILNLAYNPVSCEWIDNYIDFFKKQDLKVYPWIHSVNGCIPEE